MSETKLKAILGQEYQNVKNAIQGRFDDGLETTNQTIFDLIAYTCDDPDKKIKELKKLISGDRTNQMLVQLIGPKKESSPSFRYNKESKEEIKKQQDESHEENSCNIKIAIFYHNEFVEKRLKESFSTLKKEICFKAFKRAIKFFKNKVREGVILKDNFLNLHEIAVDDRNKKDQAILIDKPFNYTLLPEGMDIKFDPSPSYILQANKLNVVDVQLCEGKREILSEKKKEKQEALLDKFVKFLFFFAKQKYIQVERKQIEKAIKVIKEKFIGIEKLGINLKKTMETFTTGWYSLPKGVLFYGPPGTGKSAIIKELMELLPFEFLCPPLASGDFNKGIVGDSERMINQLAERARAVPWQLCCIMVDEIDALAPDRMSSGTSAHTINTLSVLLSVLDGGKEAKNFKIFATTNKFEQMDDAFCRRLDLKMFVGKPDFEARGKWIVKKMEDIGNKEEFNFCKQLITEKRKETIKAMTLNFSCDALKKFLSWLYEDFIFLRPADKNVDVMIFDRLIGICVSERIYFGPCELPKIIKDLKKIDDDPRYKEVRGFFDFTQNLGPNERASRRIFIDFNEDPRHIIQTEVVQNKFTAEQIAALAVKIETEQDIVDAFANLIEAFPNYVIPPYNYDKDLSDNTKILTKIVSTLKKVQYGHLDLPTFGINPNPDLLKDIYSILIKFALKNDLATVCLVDDNYLLRTEHSEDQSAERQMAYAIHETRKHDTGMVIFNLDSIAGLVKEYSGIKSDVKQSAVGLDQSEGMGGPSLHYTKLRPRAFQQVLNQFADANGSSDIWIVVISGHDLLTQQFKERVNWPKTRAQQEAEVADKERKTQTMCANCHCTFSEAENNENACGRHTSQLLYIQAELDILRKKYENATPEELFKKLPVYSSATVFRQLENNERTKIPASQYKWVCCDRGLFDKGEKPSRHLTS